MPTTLADFRARYEHAVPAVDLERVGGLVAAQAPWADMLDYVDTAAPFGFLTYWRTEINPIMALAGENNPCVAYLMGNHTIAEKMFRHNPAVMLYAPLRTVIWQDDTGGVWFGVDQPSTTFASFASPDIAAVGTALDAKLAALLEHLDLAVPTALRSTGTSR